MNNIVEGGCFCGSVRYSFKFDKYPSANCYCSICRRISGAPFVSWLAIPLDIFKYLNNKPKKINLLLMVLASFVMNVALL